MKLEVIPAVFAVCRLDPESQIPAWATAGVFFSISKTNDELSVVCEQVDVPDGVKSERDWRCLKVKGPLEFSLTGVLASLANPLAKAGISIFAVSTFDTDYLLIKTQDFDSALNTLQTAGHVISGSA